MSRGLPGMLGGVGRRGCTNEIPRPRTEGSVWMANRPRRSSSTGTAGHVDRGLGQPAGGRHDTWRVLDIWLLAPGKV